MDFFYKTVVSKWPQTLFMALELHFTKENEFKIYSKENKKVRNQARSVVQIEEICILHLVYFIKKLDKNFLTASCDENHIKVAAFY